MNQKTDLKTLQGQQTTDLAAMPPKQQIKHLLEKASPIIKKSMPKHLSPDRLLQVATQVCTTTPALAECYPPTLIGGVMQLGAMGLEPNTVLGHAYLIPFQNRQKNRKDVQVIIGYKGLIDLARRSGQIQSIAAHAVFEGDSFEFMYGLNEKLEHVPADGDRGEITHFYAVAHLKDGGHAFEVMTRSQVEQIMAGTQSKGKYGPWKDHFEEMGRKTAIRRLAKYLPISIDLARAVNMDEAAQDGRDQELDNVLEGTFDTVPDDTPEAALLTGEAPITDVNGEVFDPNLHGQNENGPIFNQDGTFRARRGTGPRAGKTTQQEPAQQQEPQGDPDEAAAQAALRADLKAQEELARAQADAEVNPTTTDPDPDPFGGME